MENTLTCQNLQDTVVSHAETSVFPPIGKGMKTRARILTEVWKLNGSHQIEASITGSVPIVLCHAKIKTSKCYVLLGRKGQVEQSDHLKADPQPCVKNKDLHLKELLTAGE